MGASKFLLAGCKRFTLYWRARCDTKGFCGNTSYFRALPYNSHHESLRRHLAHEQRLSI